MKIKIIAATFISALLISGILLFDGGHARTGLSLTPTTHAAPINEANAARTTTDVLITAKDAPPAPSLSEGTWINSDSLKLNDLRGRVVVVDFWTFGCYNCRNTLPTLKQWDASYRAKGLTIIGVHTPETDYEKKIGNIRRAVREQSIRYPVLTDTDGETWRAYGIEAWPTTVILDKNGRMRFRHVGEGAYDEMESVIKKLLVE